ncbi:MAG: hypothetical protein CMO81_03575 [Waddliaceae bacterium]|nr:hypothetical protein [Waddliaceae bacterium]
MVSSIQTFISEKLRREKNPEEELYGLEDLSLRHLHVLSKKYEGDHKIITENTLNVLEYIQKQSSKEKDLYKGTSVTPIPTNKKNQLSSRTGNFITKKTQQINEFLSTYLLPNKAREVNDFLKSYEGIYKDISTELVNTLTQNNKKFHLYRDKASITSKRLKKLQIRIKKLASSNAQEISKKRIQIEIEKQKIRFIEKIIYLSNSWEEKVKKESISHIDTVKDTIYEHVKNTPEDKCDQSFLNEIFGSDFNIFLNSFGLESINNTTTWKELRDSLDYTKYNIDSDINERNFFIENQLNSYENLKNEKLNLSWKNWKNEKLLNEKNILENNCSNYEKEIQKLHNKKNSTLLEIQECQIELLRTEEKYLKQERKASERIAKQLCRLEYQLQKSQDDPNLKISSEVKDLRLQIDITFESILKQIESNDASLQVTSQIIATKKGMRLLLPQRTHGNLPNLDPQFALKRDIDQERQLYTHPESTFTKQLKKHAEALRINFKEHEDLYKKHCETSLRKEIELERIYKEKKETTEKSLSSWLKKKTENPLPDYKTYTERLKISSKKLSKNAFPPELPSTFSEMSLGAKRKSLITFYEKSISLIHELINKSWIEFKENIAFSVEEILTEQRNHFVSQYIEEYKNNIMKEEDGTIKIRIDGLKRSKEEEIQYIQNNNKKYIHDISEKIIKQKTIKKLIKNNLEEILNSHHFLNDVNTEKKHINEYRNSINERINSALLLIQTRALDLHFSSSYINILDKKNNDFEFFNKIEESVDLLIESKKILEKLKENKNYQSNGFGESLKERLNTFSETQRAAEKVDKNNTLYLKEQLNHTSKLIEKYKSRLKKTKKEKLRKINKYTDEIIKTSYEQKNLLLDKLNKIDLFENSNQKKYYENTIYILRKNIDYFQKNLEQELKDYMYQNDSNNKSLLEEVEIKKQNNKKLIKEAIRTLPDEQKNTINNLVDSFFTEINTDIKEKSNKLGKKNILIKELETQIVTLKENKNSFSIRHNMAKESEQARKELIEVIEEKKDSLEFHAEKIDPNVDELEEILKSCSKPSLEANKNFLSPEQLRRIKQKSSIGYNLAEESLHFFREYKSDPVNYFRKLRPSIEALYQIALKDPNKDALRIATNLRLILSISSNSDRISTMRKQLEMTAVIDSLLKGLSGRELPITWKESTVFSEDPKKDQELRKLCQFLDDLPMLLAIAKGVTTEDQLSGQVLDSAFNIGTAALKIIPGLSGISDAISASYKALAPSVKVGWSVCTNVQWINGVQNLEKYINQRDRDILVQAGFFLEGEYMNQAYFAELTKNMEMKGEFASLIVKDGVLPKPSTWRIFHWGRNLLEQWWSASLKEKLYRFLLQVAIPVGVIAGTTTLSILGLAIGGVTGVGLVVAIPGILATFWALFEGFWVYQEWMDTALDVHTGTNQKVRMRRAKSEAKKWIETGVVREQVKEQIEKITREFDIKLNLELFDLDIFKNIQKRSEFEKTEIEKIFGTKEQFWVDLKLHISLKNSFSDPLAEDSSSLLDLLKLEKDFDKKTKTLEKFTKIWTEEVQLLRKQCKKEAEKIIKTQLIDIANEWIRYQTYGKACIPNDTGTGLRHIITSNLSALSKIDVEKYRQRDEVDLAALKNIYEWEGTKQDKEKNRREPGRKYLEKFLSTSVKNNIFFDPLSETHSNEK